MTDDESGRGGTRATGRATKNALVRATGDITGKLASLVLFAALARTVGADDLGAYVLAFAWVELATTPIGLGLDRYLLRVLSRGRGRETGLVRVALRLKLVRAVPITAASWALLNVLDYSAQTREAVYVLSAGLLLDALGRSFFAQFNASERAQFVAASVVAQRFTAAGLGLAALAAGYGVVTVAAAYTAGSAVGFAVAGVALRRTGPPPRPVPQDEARSLSRGARPFAVADVLGVVLSRIDAVMLSLIATTVAVGLYGGAYRLLEATFFLGSALHGASAAMFTYLSADSDPPLHAVFERTIRAALIVLAPISIAYAIEADAIARAFLGDEFGGAGDALRLLAPVVACAGIVNLSISLIVARRGAGSIVWITGGAAVVNVAANAALIPVLDEVGAALAMLVTYTLYALTVFVLAVRSAGRFDAVRNAGPALAGAGAMAAVMLAAPGPAGARIAAGALAYLALVAVLERAANPADLRTVTRMVRRRLTPVRT